MDKQSIKGTWDLSMNFLNRYRTLFRNRIVGFLIGRYNLRSEVKRLFIKGEQFVSGTEVVQYNESVYIIALLLICCTIILSFVNAFFLFSLLAIPVILALSNELEIIIASNERIIIIRRALFEKLLKIQHETTILLDQIVLIEYFEEKLDSSFRSPFHAVK